MGIDGIGKAPPIAPPGGSESTGGVTGSGGEFRVGETTAPTPAGALARLERGEIQLEEYLDARVNEATAERARKLTNRQMPW